jgi:hypothetical protein
MKLYCIYLPLAILALAGVRPLRAQSYTFRVAECGAYTAYPKGMNTDGTVVGGAQTLNSIESWAFIYADGACKTIGPGQDGISFTGIADNGELLGIYSAGSFLFEQGALQNLPAYPGSEFTDYCCLNTSTGVLAGNYLVTASPLQYGFLYDSGTLTPLPFSYYHYAPSITGMNNKGVVVGTMNSSSLYGFTYTGGKIRLFEYPNSVNTTFNGVNDDGLIVGTFVRDGAHPGTGNLFTYNLGTGVWTDLNFPGEYAAVVPVGIANSGLIAAKLSPSGAGLLIATPAN